MGQLIHSAKIGKEINAQEYHTCSHSLQNPWIAFLKMKK